MKEIYYYIRDEKNRPMTTICIMQDEHSEDVSKGIAFCSEKDIPCKKVGRKIARERAKYALNCAKDSCPTKRKEARKSQSFFPFKSCYLPILTDYEYEIINWYLKTAKS